MIGPIFYCEQNIIFDLYISQFPGFALREVVEGQRCLYKEGFLHGDSEISATAKGKNSIYAPGPFGSNICMRFSILISPHPNLLQKQELQNQNFLTCGSTGTGRKWTAIFRISHFQKSKCSFQVFCILGITLISMKLLTLVNTSYSLYLYLISKSSPIIQ